MTRRRPRCPICGRPSDPEAPPFCSRRCAELDLAAWLGEAYRAPAAPDDDAPEPTVDDEGRGR